MSHTDAAAPPPRRNRPSRTAALAFAVGLALTGVLAGCGGDDYCGAVHDHQAELTDATGSGSPAALLAGLSIFEDLRDQAPDDLRDDWKAFVDPLAELDAALRDAGVDPATYDATKLPEGLTDAQQTRIEAAGAALAQPSVVSAFDSVQQQAKDVCHTPLSL